MLEELERSLETLKTIHEDQLLPQTFVLLVGTLEVYLSTVFEACFADKFAGFQPETSDLLRRVWFQDG
jgi:hypothetical protein